MNIQAGHPFQKKGDGRDYRGRRNERRACAYACDPATDHRPPRRRRRRAGAGGARPCRRGCGAAGWAGARRAARGVRRGGRPWRGSGRFHRRPCPSPRGAAAAVVGAAGFRRAGERRAGAGRAGRTGARSAPAGDGACGGCGGRVARRRRRARLRRARRRGAGGVGRGARARSGGEPTADPRIARLAGRLPRAAHGGDAVRQHGGDALGGGCRAVVGFARSMGCAALRGAPRAQPSRPDRAMDHGVDVR